MNVRLERILSTYVWNWCCRTRRGLPFLEEQVLHAAQQKQWSGMLHGLRILILQEEQHLEYMSLLMTKKLKLCNQRRSYPRWKFLLELLSKANVCISVQRNKLCATSRLKIIYSTNATFTYCIINVEGHDLYFDKASFPS